MDFFEAIDKRHTYRGSFLPQPVPRSDLRRIVQAGIQAPSGCNAQTTSFVVVDIPAVLARVCEVLALKEPPPAFIVCITMRQIVFRNMQFELEDCCVSVENMLLATTALGYATGWTDSVLRVAGRAERIGEILGVPSDRRVRVILPIGIPAETGQQARRLPFDQRVWFNRYDS